MPSYKANKHATSVKAPSFGEFTDTDAVIFWVFWGFFVSCFSACCFGFCGSRGRTPRPGRHRVQRLASQQEESVREEEALESRIHVMESQLTARRLQRQVATARLNEETAVVKMTEAADERGRAVYGDAWDEPVASRNT
jgi:hypothetical protein